jgi:hypothetical protein
MRKFILIALSLLAIVTVSCKEETKAEKFKRKVNESTEKVIEKAKEIKKPKLEMNMSDPALMGGGAGIIGIIKTGLNYTARGYELTDFVSLSESEMTKEEAEAYLNKKRVKFLNVKRVRAANDKGDVLACQTSISITKNLFRGRTVVENDTCKIVLPIME